MGEKKYLESLNHVFLKWFNYELAKKTLEENGFYVFELVGDSYYQLKTNATVSQLREMLSFDPEMFGYPYCGVCEPGMINLPRASRKIIPPPPLFPFMGYNAILLA